MAMPQATRPASAEKWHIWAISFCSSVTLPNCSASVPIAMTSLSQVHRRRGQASPLVGRSLNDANRIRVTVDLAFLRRHAGLVAVNEVDNPDGGPQNEADPNHAGNRGCDLSHENQDLEVQR